jgi:hypothetical protein
MSHGFKTFPRGFDNSAQPLNPDSRATDQAMQQDPKDPSNRDNIGGVPPALSAFEPPVGGTAPPVGSAAPPPLPGPPVRKSAPMRHLLTILLSLCLGLFLADAVISLTDDSLILLFGIHVLASIRGIVFLFSILMAIAIYGLMGITPAIPKRLFLPLTLFNPVAVLAGFPVLIFFYDRMQQMTWCFSLVQVICGFYILYLVQGRFKFRWPLISERQLGARRFSWPNLLVFLAANVFVLLPAVILYLVSIAGVAVNHFSEGFMTVRPAGLTVQARRYVRHDGKVIQLFPMSHVGDASFYHKLSLSFPTNSVILMEGVTDNRNLLTNKVTYKRMANALGVAEQQEEFSPEQGEMVWADVDVEQFTPSTIGLLNMVMLVHAKGLTVETVLKLLEYSPSPQVQEQLFDDLLRKRNRHLLGELNSQLSKAEYIVVPWGVAHMPEIAKEIQRSGFRLEATQDYVAIRFHSDAKSNKAVRNKVDGTGK